MIASKLTLPKFESREIQTVEKPQNLAHNFFPKYVQAIAEMINLTYKVNARLGCRLTMGMLSIAIRKKIRKADLAFYHAGTKTKYVVEGRKFYTYTFGEGDRSLLLLHGFCSNGARWRKYINPLIEAGYKVTVMDAPGHGTSPGIFMSVPSYIKTTKAVLQSQASWSGILSHSMGSLVGSIALRELPEVQIEKLVLMNTFATCSRLMTQFALFLGIEDRVISHTRDWIPEYTGRPLSHYTLLDSFPNHDFSGLLIHDTSDVIVPKDESLKIRNFFPNWDVEVTHGLGHNLRSPDTINRTLQFLTSVQ